MNFQLIFVLLLLAACVVMFVLNRPRMDVVAVLVMVALPLAGIISVQEALAGFSDPSVVLIAALFIVGEGLVRTGVAERIGSFLLHRSSGSETRLLVLLMLAVALLGAVMSSTGVVAIFIPVVLLLATRQGIAPGRLMMPLSFAGLISGMLTLVGTPPNLVIDSALRHSGHEGFGFFDFTPFGLVILFAGIGYMLIARRWLNRAGGDPSPRGERRKLMDFVHDYHLEGREHRLRVKKGSPMVGMTLQQLAEHRTYDANVVAIERWTRTRHEMLDPQANVTLRAGDVLLVDFAAPADGAHASLLERMMLEPLPPCGSYFTDHSRELGMAEVLIPPDSELVGRTVLQAGFRTKYHLTVIGLRRGPGASKANILEEKLRPGDALLVIGRWKHIRGLRQYPRDFLVLSLPAEMDHVVLAGHRAPYALGSLAVMVVLMVTGWVPNVLAALIACLLMGLTRCVTLQSAYKALQWPSLILIVGMIPFSAALQKTGGVDLAAQGLLHLFGAAEPRVMLAALFAFTALTGLFISNTATAVLVAPIALSVAAGMGLSPYPFAMTVALAASTAFMTPISSPVNTLVLVPGKYRFGDFVRVGVPFAIVVLVLTVLLVPWLLPLHR